MLRALPLLSLWLACGASAASLDATCFAPKSLGGLGFCGPEACASSTVASSKAPCDYATGATAINYATAIARTACKSCTQVMSVT